MTLPRTGSKSSIKVQEQFAASQHVPLHNHSHNVSGMLVLQLQAHSGAEIARQHRLSYADAVRQDYGPTSRCFLRACSAFGPCLQTTWPCSCRPACWACGARLGRWAAVEQELRSLRAAARGPAFGPGERAGGCVPWQLRPLWRTYPQRLPRPARPGRSVWSSPPRLCRGGWLR